ncbi:MAG: AAA family ATPase [Oscillospiraceae bacterium]|nr:AAA family ATPase [Oscillospiraceae bacterium]
MTLSEILSRLEGVKGSGGSYKAKCPAHQDSTPSLSVGLGRDRRILLKCHAGCQTEDIVAALGLTMKDLFDAVTPEDAFPSYGSKKDAWKEAEYLYPGGQFKKIKMRHSDGGKHCFWQRWSGTAWENGRNGQKEMLYYHEPLQNPVFLVEGEKDVDTLHQLGFSAVSLPDGSSSQWFDNYGLTFYCKDVFVLQDNDAPGKEFAQRVAGELQKDAKSVRVLDLTQAWPELPEKGDVSDLIAHHGPERGLDELARLMSDTPIWTPEAVTDDFLSLFRPLTDFNEEEATWLVPGWIPEAQITLIAADGGIGKTTLWINIMAALSTGKACILDPPGTTRTPVKVAFCTTEDSIRKKLLKKLREAGANMANIIAMDLAADKGGLLRKFKFGSPEMGRFVKYFKPAACAFDPVQGFVPPEINMGSRNAMRDCLAPLITLGEDTGTTFLVICHTNKRKGAFGRDRIADSADLWDIARSVIMAGYTKDQGVRYLSNEKNNYAPLQETVLFSIGDGGQLVKEGTTWKRDREFTQEAQQGSAAPARESCKEFLIQTLLDATGGAMPTSDLEAAAKKAGHAFAAVRRAKGELKKEGRVEYFQTGGNGDKVWHIRLLDGPGEFEELAETEPNPFAPPSEI